MVDIMKEFNSLNELLNSKEFEEFMQELEDSGWFEEQQDKAVESENLADTGRFSDFN